MSGLKEVELVSTGVYLPGEPIPFDNLEDVLGKFDKAPRQVKRMEDKLRSLSKDLIGIEQVYYAIDPKSGKFTENNTTMAAKAIKSALKKAELEPEEVDCLLYGNALPDMQTPPTSTLIQEELGIEKCAEMELHSNCSAISKLLQIAMDSLRLGRYRNVVVAYSQMSSVYLHSSYYNQDKVRTESFLLRWFLSDAASALVLKAREKVNSGLKLEFVDNLSIGGKKKPGMWLNLGTRNFDLLKAYQDGQHHFCQDYRTTNDIGPACFYEAFERLIAQSGLKYSDVDYILATLPSKKLWEYGKLTFEQKYGITPDKWFGNVNRLGYAGASSVIIALDEILNKKLLKPQDLLASVIFESSKWMIGGFILKVL
jgi:3-oxoacyl-[acyl-carrier-protein] synthase III